MIAHQVHGPDADEDNDASMEMMAVRIMTQSLFPDFSGCVPILYVSSDNRDIVFLGNVPIPKYKAPARAHLPLCLPGRQRLVLKTRPSLIA